MLQGNRSPDTREFIFCSQCERRLCKTCGKNPAEKIKSSSGKEYYRPECCSCSHKRYKIKDERTHIEKDPWKRLSHELRTEIGKCERCGFIPEHIGQLDVDHIDGNSKNHDRTNLQVLCSNCHRIKTILSGDGKNKRPYNTRPV